MATKNKVIKECELIRDANEAFSAHQAIRNKYFNIRNPGVIRLENPKDRNYFVRRFVERHKREAIKMGFEVKPCRKF